MFFSLKPSRTEADRRTVSGKKLQGLKRKAEQHKCSNYRYMQNNSDQEREVRTEKVSAVCCCVERKIRMMQDIWTAASHYLRSQTHTKSALLTAQNQSTVHRLSTRHQRLRSASPPTNCSPHFLLFRAIGSPADSLCL